MLTQDEVIRLFEEKEAFLSGHFLLSSGLHSPRYLQTALLLQYPDLAEKFGKELAERAKDCKPDVVAAPAVGGLIIGHEVAKAFGVRFVYTERVEGKMVFRRGFEIKPGEKVFTVDSVITTGGSPLEVMDEVTALGGINVGCAVVVNRSSGRFNPQVPLFSLMEITVPAYDKEDCPLCKEGLPLVKPGSKK